MNKEASEFLASLKTNEIGLSAKDIQKISSMLHSESQPIFITVKVNYGMNAYLSHLLGQIKQSV